MITEKVGCGGCPNYILCTKAVKDRPYCPWYVNRPIPAENDRMRWYVQKNLDFGEHLNEA